MSSYTQSIQNLMTELASLPGVGTRSAERIAFHLLKQRPEDALRLADAIRDVKTRIKHCTICFNLTEQDPCNICSNSSRDQSVVCVVEQPKDLLALESTGLYRGVYHVLLGRIAPLEGVDPADVTADALLHRLASGTIREVIMGTNPNIEGDGTALHIQQQIAERFPDVQITRPRSRPASGEQYRIRQSQHPLGRDQRSTEDVTELVGPVTGQRCCCRGSPVCPERGEPPAHRAASDCLN